MICDIPFEFKGVKSEREYVASQGPLERTAADHWRMIWELNIRIIAMLTTCEEGDLIFKVWSLILRLQTVFFITS